MNPFLPRSFGLFVVFLTLGIVGLFFGLGLLADFAVTDGAYHNRGFFTLELRLGGGTRFWVIQLFCALLAHGAVLANHAVLAGQVTRGSTQWFGVHVRFPALIMAAKSMTTTTLVVGVFFVIRNSDRFCI